MNHYHIVHRPISFVWDWNKCKYVYPNGECGEWMRGYRVETHKSQEACITQALLYYTYTYSNWVTTKEYGTQAVMIVRQARRQSRIEVMDNVPYGRGHAASAVPDLCVCV